MGHMSRRLTAILVCLLTTAQGCSIFCAATAPSPIPVQEIQPGRDRSAIISVLGTPTSTEQFNGERTDMHEFISGYDSGSKLRIVFYAAGDFFSLGLAEVIFWPLEVFALQGDQGRAVITYDPNNIAKTVLLTKRDGASWGQSEPTKFSTGSDPATESMTGYEYRQEKSRVGTEEEEKK